MKIIIIKKKLKKTCLEKYGETSPLKNKSIWNKTRENIIKKYGAAYNKEKYSKTILEKYGTKYYVESDDFKSKVDYKEISRKGFITKKKNNTYNKSKLEDESYILLKEKYFDIIPQYRSMLYPFACDFYIPSIDLYIECNYFWTHGEFPYIKEEQKCIDKLNLWKSKNTKFYNNAIETWTIRDTKKRNIAKENNLNWIEFFNIDELKNWLNKHGESINK